MIDQVMDKCSLQFGPITERVSGPKYVLIIKKFKCLSLSKKICPSHNNYIIKTGKNKWSLKYFSLIPSRAFRLIRVVTSAMSRLL